MSTALPKAVPRLLSSVSRFPSLSIRLTLRPSLMVTICRLAIAPWPELSSPQLSAIASHVQPRTCPFHTCNALIARRVSHFSSSALLHLETRHQASIRYSKLRFYSLPVVCKQHSQAHSTLLGTNRGYVILSASSSLLAFPDLPFILSAPRALRQRSWPLASAFADHSMRP